MKGTLTSVPGIEEVGRDLGVEPGIPASSALLSDAQFHFFWRIVLLRLSSCRVPNQEAGVVHTFNYQESATNTLRGNFAPKGLTDP